MIDGYKTDHRRQYPDGTTMVYSNMTPRASRVPGVDHVVFFGLQYFIKEYLIDRFQNDFFQRPLGAVCDEYGDVMDAYLGKDAVPVEHIEKLHDLGYLPLLIKALPEGTRCPLRVPMLTIRNTHPDFFWLTNQLETILSTSLWVACTSATTAYEYRRAFNKAAKETGIDPVFCRFQGHDFSFRGMTSRESAIMSGMGHLTSFMGTDTIPAILGIRKYYGDDLPGIGCSVPASEHSTMCLGMKEGERETYKRFITEIYPKGIVSVVSDTWDFWKVLTETLPSLKNEIMTRDGKLVIRPDSGDPVKIIVGDPSRESWSPESRGAYQVLWDKFGGTITKEGYRKLDSHIGLIYGDAITRERQDQIIAGLKAKAFCPDVVLGIGSYSYQYVTRDTYGFAVKSTYGEVNGEAREIFKDPKTDDGTKKSLRGLIHVDAVNGILTAFDQQDWHSEGLGILEPVFRDGNLGMQHSLEAIRTRLHGENW